MSQRFPVRRAAHIIRHGGVIAHPTEGVFGLACDPHNIEALERILAIKSRDRAKGVILLAHSADAVQPYCAPFNDDMRARLEGAHRRPVTFVVPAARTTHPLLTGGRRTLAVRVTHHAFSRALCAELGQPIVSTSANRGGRPPARTARAVRRALGGDLDLIVSGPLGGATGPSEIRDVVTGKILRPSTPPELSNREPE